MWAWSLGLALVSGLVGGTGVGCGSSFVAGFGGGLLGVIHRLAHLALELGVQRLALLDRNLTLLDEFVDELAALLVSGGKGSDARQQDLAQAITQKIKSAMIPLLRGPTWPGAMSRTTKPSANNRAMY